MKTIKNLATLLLVVFSISMSTAQSTDSNKLIVNKWVIDKEAMKPIIAMMLATNPQFAGLDEATKSSTLDMALEQASSLKVEYKADGTMLRTDPTGETAGTWSLSADSKELTTKAEGKPDKKYTVLVLSKTSLSMMSADGRNIILKAAQ
jgi:hypothetical protein